MNPQLLMAAQRLAPILSRLNAGAGRMFGMKANMLNAPDPEVVPTDAPRQAPATPSAPLSINGDWFTPNGQAWSAPKTPNERVAETFDALPQDDPVPMPQPRPPEASQVPMPQPRPAGAPQAAQPEQMNWFQRNAMMQTDPSTGEFLDPIMAAQAQQANVTGPDLIQKFMKYFHTKTA